MCAQRSKSKIAADLTKWTVSLAVGGALLYRHDAIALLYVAGAALNSLSGKALKQVIRQPRPTSAKSDPGMPSSHATSLSFLSLAVLAHFVAEPHPQLARLSVGFAGVLLAGVATSWRVKAGYHTREQVAAGWVLGTVNTVLWARAFVPVVRPGLEAVMKDDAVALILVSSTLAAASFFILSPDLDKFLKALRQ